MRVGIWVRAAALLLAAALSGCVAESLNPVTGKPIYAPTSPVIEARYGEKARAELVAEYGVYNNIALTAYVGRIGQALAANVVRKDVTYTFTILDDDDINAFALPGGYVYITRGALNYANSEAEVAGILGHEIGHVDAWHFKRGEDDTVKRVFSVLLRHSSTSADDLAMAQKLAEESTQSAGYSQEQELEADALAIHYMALAGYDPQAMVRAIHAAGLKTTLDEAAMAGNPVARDILALDQSHPATPLREARALDAAKGEAAKGAAANSAVPAPGAGSTALAGRRADRDAYLAAVDGMTFGVDPGEGTVERNRLVNAALDFSFEAPEGFDLWTSRGGAFGAGRNAVLFIGASQGHAGQSMVNYVQSSMMEKLDVENVRPLDIEGYRGATGVVMSDDFVVRLGAVLDRRNHLYELLYVTPRRAFQDLDAGFLESLNSFHSLEGAEARPRPSLRLRVVTVAAGDTVESLAERMALKEQKLEWFRVLNGLDPEDAVQAGDKVKLVEER